MKKIVLMAALAVSTVLSVQAETAVSRLDLNGVHVPNTFVRKQVSPRGTLTRTASDEALNKAEAAATKVQAASVTQEDNTSVKNGGFFSKFCATVVSLFCFWR